MRQAIIAFMVLLFVSCSAVSCGQRTRTPSPFISQQEAIDIALKISSMPQPEISGALTKPVNIQAERTTLAIATKRLMGTDSVGAGYSLDMTVWLITMDGTWTDEFPRETDLPTPEPYHHYGVILNASTGEDILTSAHP
jgi:hypothetical protein